MKGRFRTILAGLGAVIMLVVAGFVAWAGNPLGPGEQALAALDAGEAVRVDAGNTIIFEPTDVEPVTGLVFYPGGRVDYRSYAPLLREIAAQGYLVALVPAPLNLMVFNPDKAADIFPQFPHIKHWAVGGHSLGGAMAANFLYNHPQAAGGLVLWASYPAESNDLSGTGLKVLSIYGTLDMGGLEPFEDSRARLPADTFWVVIDGGNHAQFGDYGPQPGDHPATMSAQEQQDLVVAATADFLRSLDR